jgi:tetratricopeptide (TPR) repeat protein
MKRPRLAPALCALSVLAFGSFVWAASPDETEAEEYMQTWEERGREACKDNERGCAAAGHALDRAAAAYEKAGRLDKAMAIRKMILDPQWHLDYTDYGRAAMFRLARNHQSLTEYGEAAQLIETAVRRFAKSDEAPDALNDAFLFRLALGEFDKAQEDIQLFSKNYGSSRSGDLAKLMYALATTFWEQNRPQDALSSLQKQMAFIDRHGSLQYRALAHALLGRIHARDGATAKAAAEFGIVRDIWERPYDAVKQLEALGGTDDEKMRRLGQVVTVVGEAMFFFAEQIYGAGRQR